MTERAETFGWELLVTDGHVRAARVRRLRPRLIAASAVLLLAGWWLLEVADPPKAENDRASVLTEAVERNRLPATIAFGGLPAPRVGISRLKELPLADTLPAMQGRILTELDRADRVPTDLKIREVDPSVFWRVPWKAGEMVTTGNRGARLVGGLVNAGNPDFPIAARWLAAFREQDDRWTAVTIQGPDFVEPPGTPAVAIEEIPITLRPLLKTKE
jgi:hypothetical protein